ncbi:unnamed protein product, partial [marine sediment metagenome]
GKEQLVKVSANGLVSYLRFTFDSFGAGVLILGKIQHSRGRNIQLHGVEIENVVDVLTGPPLPGHTVFAKTSFDGKTTFPHTAGSVDTQNPSYVVEEGNPDNYVVDGDGNFVIVTEGILQDPLRKYNFRVSGKNHSIIIFGGFDLVTTLITYSILGHR